MGGRPVHRPYNKIVGPFCPRGLGLRQVVHRPADPPQRIERARGADGQAAVAELHTGGGNGERNVEAIVDEQERWKVGQSDCKAIVVETSQLAAAGVKREIATSAIGQRTGDADDVGPSRDALIGDGMQARQRWSHVNLTPGLSRAPRNHASVAMRSFPAGCTSTISTLPPASWDGPVAITSAPSAESSSPGTLVP